MCSMYKPQNQSEEKSFKTDHRHALLKITAVATDQIVIRI